MKRFLSTVFTFVLAFSGSVFAQNTKPMASPPATATGLIDSISVTVSYHQPSVKGRKIMGDLVPFGKVWRTGANATTSIEFSKAVKIEGKTLEAGKYALFTVPGEKEWEIVFNKKIAWGDYSYDKKDDVLRVKVPAGKSAAFVEMFTIAVEKAGVSLAWENTQVKFGITK